MARNRPRKIGKDVPLTPKERRRLRRRRRRAEERRLWEKVKPTPIKKKTRRIDPAKQAVTAPPGTIIYPIKGKRLPAIFITRQTVRVRLKDPGRYAEFRTHDVGREGHTKRIAGLNKDTGKWETQAWIFQKSDIRTNRKTRAQFRVAVTLAKTLGGKYRRKRKRRGGKRPSVRTRDRVRHLAPEIEEPQWEEWEEEWGEEELEEW